MSKYAAWPRFDEAAGPSATFHSFQLAKAPAPLSCGLFPPPELNLDASLLTCEARADSAIRAPSVPTIAGEFCHAPELVGEDSVQQSALCVRCPN